MKYVININDKTDVQKVIKETSSRYYLKNNKILNKENMTVYDNGQSVKYRLMTTDDFKEYCKNSLNKSIDYCSFHVLDLLKTFDKTKDKDDIHFKYLEDVIKDIFTSLKKDVFKTLDIESLINT